MRTDTNSVLSLSSVVPSKKPAKAQPVSQGRADFASDFSKAKESMAPRKNAEAPHETGVETVQDKAPTSKETQETGQVAQKSEALPVEKNTSNAVTDETSEDSIVVQGGGKSLQQQGEQLPVESLVMNAGNDPVEFVSPDVVSINPQVASSDQLKVIQDGDALLVVSDTADLSEEVVPGAEGAGVAEMASITSSLVGETKRIVPEEIKSSPATVKLTEVSFDSLVNDGELDAQHEAQGELTWVLLQMGGGYGKSVIVEGGDQVALETAKSTVAAAVSASVMDQQAKIGVATSGLATGEVAGLKSDMAIDGADTLLADDVMLLNEAPELRKKEQDAMISRIVAQVEGRADDGSSNNGTHLLNAASARPAAAVSMGAANPNINLTMSLPPGHPGWVSEMTQKVSWIARDGGHTAHIRLDPPELGSLTVKVSVDSDSNTQISFVAATPQARDLLDSQMGRLRDMLAQQGMDLSRADVDVSQQDASGAQDRANNPSGGASSIMANSEEDEGDLMSERLSYVSASGVDYYA